MQPGDFSDTVPSVYVPFLDVQHMGNDGRRALQVSFGQLVLGWALENIDNVGRQSWMAITGRDYVIGADFCSQDAAISALQAMPVDFYEE